MAEMTAQEAIKLLKRQDNKYLIDYQLHEIAALIQQQAQTIDHQNLQIAKLQEDLIKAISGKE